MSRPAESSSGLRNTEPAFAPPGWCSRRQRTTSSMRSPQAAGSSAAPTSSAPVTTSVAVEVGVAVAEVELVGGSAGTRRGARSEVGDPRPVEHLARLPAVPTRVHAHRATDRAGDPDEELEPTQPGRRRLPGQDRQRHGAAGAGAPRQSRRS